MLVKIEEKTKALREKDDVIKELLTLMTKFKSQLSNQDELMKLLSTYNNSSIRPWYVNFYKICFAFNPTIIWTYFI